MAKKSINSYPFYQVLREFYIDSKTKIRRTYKRITKKILDYNDPLINSNAFLRTPQFEALEMYVFIKEFLNNQQMSDIFAKWYNSKGEFESRGTFSSYSENGVNVQYHQKNLFDDLTAEVYEDVFDLLKKNQQSYSNYIYALTMGTGKTILMATCIFYEFLLANKFPEDERYCHNALVFAPDKTVLQSLKEIQTFDLKKVIPSEYANFLTTNVKFHYLDDKSTTLNTIDGSDFNIVISNTQKIILKAIHKEKNATDKLFGHDQIKLDFGNDFLNDIYAGLDELKDEKEVTVNQRFEKIIRLKQLGVYVDEAHHLFGSDLLSSLSDSSKETSLRFTINKIAEILEKNGSKLVACYNYTGTPYVENRVLPEVVYSYGLKQAISNRYLKEVEIQGYDNVKNNEFLRRILTDFFKYYGDNLYEGLKPKIAIFGATIEEVVNEIKPEVEGILNDLGIDLNTILVNVGDSVVTKNDDIVNFNNLDVVGTEGSRKQVILLVNKGREGWNCRSLFAVGLYRAPKSKIFVLQSTMRCLRSITELQQIAHVYLSKENYEILDNELKKNFNIDIKQVTAKNNEKKQMVVKIVPPVKNITLEEIRKVYNLEESNLSYPFKIDLSKIDLEKYKSVKTVQKGIGSSFGPRKIEFVSDENKKYSSYLLIAEIARYLNLSPIKIENILEESNELQDITNLVSQYNDILYDEIIPAIFNYLYIVKEETNTETKVVPLIRYRKDTDKFIFNCSNELALSKNDAFVRNNAFKSFHVDTYCFDSKPEKTLFMDLLESDKVKEVYFTGMFTGSENGLSVQYIDPVSQIIRTYYPDILVYYKDGSVEIIEVKGDNKLDDKEVEAKAYAAMELAEQSKMKYNIYKSSDIMNGRIKIK